MKVPLPQWAEIVVQPEDMNQDSIMLWVLSLARRHVENRTGGPFAAAIIDDQVGRVVAIGLNLVQPLQCSMFHAEIVAIMRAQDSQGTWDLATKGSFTMYTSAEPCAMCMGSIPWSGISRVIIAARDEDVRHIGFDEGIKPSNWIEGFQARGIQVVRDVQRSTAIDILSSYRQLGGTIYNGLSLKQQE
jgi:tRNA(Arg) A34 adenosine deaminase TadA